MTRSISTFVIGALTALTLTVSVSAQITYLSEDFSSASGATPPTGWTSTATGTSPALWRADNPGGRSFTGGLFAGNFMICDNDITGSGTSGTSVLTSPAFDVSAASVANLSFDVSYRDLGSTALVEVFDGVAWNLVADFSGASVGYPNPEVAQMFDITAAAGGATNAQLRFNYSYGWDYWWAVDNVAVDEPAAFDVALASIDAPTSASFPVTDPCGGNIPAGPSTVTATIQNVGATAVLAGTLVTMEFDVDGVNVASENVLLPADLLPNGTFQYTYTATASILTSGPHDIICRVILGGDAVPGNDESQSFYTINDPILVSTGWTEDFDALAGQPINAVPLGWVNVQGDSTSTYRDWRHGASTPSTNGGPQNGDHTSGMGEFMYIEDSGSADPIINLQTPCLDLSGPFSGMAQLTFWHHSDVAPGSADDNPLSIDVVDPSGMVLVADAAIYLGNGLGSDWTQQVFDLTPYIGSTVRVQFRGTNASSNFVDDESIDDVALIDFTGDTGQAPQPGLAVLDIDNAVNMFGFGVGSNQNGPYFTSVTQGGPFTISFEGQPNQPLTSFFAPLNRAVATFGAVGQMDVGIGALDPMTGFPVDLVVFGNGILWATTPGAPFSFDSLWITNGAGTGAMTLNMPNFGAAPGTVLTTFQFGILSPAAPFAYLSNAVELTLN